MVRLNRHIGSYPPHFSSEEQRQKIYKKWLDLMSDAEAYAKLKPESEDGWHLLSELYRQGHNMDVKQAGEKTIAILGKCLAKYPRSVGCHQSAAYFYLSVGPGYLPQAEHSLSTLRAIHSPKLDPEVESGYVFLHIYRGDAPAAKGQIDQYLKHFPKDGRAEIFKDIRKGLDNPIKGFDDAKK